MKQLLVLAACAALLIGCGAETLYQPQAEAGMKACEPYGGVKLHFAGYNRNGFWAVCANGTTVYGPIGESK